MPSISRPFSVQRAGRPGALVEAGPCGGEGTGCTTEKGTSLDGLICAELADRVGDETAAAYGRSNEAALHRIAELVDALDIKCDFERVPAYTFCTDPANLDRVRAEAETAVRLGLPAAFVERPEVQIGRAHV